MYYKVVEEFGPESGDAWLKYLSWRGLHLTQFDSVDGGLRRDVFTLDSEEDWDNCFSVNDKLPLINNLNYALKIHKKNPSTDLVGIETDIEKGYQEKTSQTG